MLAGGLLQQGIRGGLLVERVVLALAGCHHLERQVAGELDETDGLGGFIAAAQRVDLAGVPGQRRQQETDGDITFDIQQADVLARAQRGQGQSRSHVRYTGGVDDHVDIRLGQRDRVGEHRVPLAAVGVGVDTDGLVSVDDPVGVDVGDGADLQAGDSLYLGDEPGSHLAGAGQADPDRATGLLFAFLQSRAVSHGALSKVLVLLVSSVVRRRR